MKKSGVNCRLFAVQKTINAAIMAARDVCLLYLNAILDAECMSQGVCLPYSKAGCIPAPAHQIREGMFVYHTKNHAMRNCLPCAALPASTGHHTAMIAGHTVQRC